MKHSSKKHSEKTEQDQAIEDLVARLGRASKRLNAAAQRATHRIEALEERLVGAEPGVETWGPTLLKEQVPLSREGSETSEAAERVVTLGYAKVKKGKWGIVARDVVKTSSGTLVSDEISHLHKAERNLRLLALPHLSTLTRQMVETIEAQTAGLDDGEDDGDEAASRQGNEAAAHADN